MLSQPRDSYEVVKKERVSIGAGNKKRELTDGLRNSSPPPSHPARLLACCIPSGRFVALGEPLRVLIGQRQRRGNQRVDDPHYPEAWDSHHRQEASRPITTRHGPVKESWVSSRFLTLTLLALHYLNRRRLPPLCRVPEAKGGYGGNAESRVVWLPRSSLVVG